MTYPTQISQQLNLRPANVAAAIELLDGGNTLPFVARYRKEATGGLDEEQLRQIESLLETLRALDERRGTILKSVEEQGYLTPELERQIRNAANRTELEDLYQPYRPKRRTRATIARERGLAPLADLIVSQATTHQSLAQLAAPYLSEDVPTVEEAWAGARDIVAEQISDHPAVRGGVRDKALRWSVLTCQKIDKADDARQVYHLYYQFQSRIDRLRPYQILAINRGEAEKILRVRLEVSERDWVAPIQAQFRANRKSPLQSQLQLAIADAAERLLLPAIERDVRRTLTEQAERHAIEVFAKNLRGLLGQPPLSGRVILGIDPAYRTGCKLAVIDPTGKVLDTGTIYPHPPQKRTAEALETLWKLVGRFGVSLIAIGNGTASRETEQLVADLIREQPAAATLQYLIVNEAGASVYSASPLARAELPELDVSLRGAVSIARRVQDPLAELIKVDPKSIGVGLYQHDVDQKQLDTALAAVVESVVNRVGVDVNTASPALLSHVAGIGPSLAGRIVAYRDRHGPFPDRAALREVNGLGPKAFEQAAGFLRIRDGKNPLDASAIHPESYGVARQLLRRVGLTAETPPDRREAPLAQLQASVDLTQLAAELKTGVPTLQDILEQLVRPGRDPREDAPAPILRQDVLAMEDLAPGMRLKGTVRNVVEFGAFIDIGVKQDGLLHRSQVEPGMALTVGDVVEVAIRDVEVERGRISLTLP